MARVGKIRVSTGILSGNNAASGAPTDAANGVAVPKGRKAEWAHLFAKKANVATFKVWGYETQTAGWFELDEINMGRTGNESQLLRGVVAWSRLCEQRVDANVANTGCNTYWGFSE